MMRFWQAPRRTRRLLALVLPLLVLRALIPAGFMPIAEGGGLIIGLCPGAAGMPPGHAHHGGHPHGEPHAPCLFAASAAPAFSPLALALPPASAVALRAALPALNAPCLPSILRSQTPRGPPAAARYS